MNPAESGRETQTRFQAFINLRGPSEIVFKWYSNFLLDKAHNTHSATGTYLVTLHEHFIFTARDTAVL